MKEAIKPAKKHGILYKIDGGFPIIAEIQCSGAKNLATKAIIAALLAESSSYLHNIPRIGDVEITIDMVRSTGAQVNWIGQDELVIDPTTMTTNSVSLPDSGSNRIPILLLSILLQKFNTVTAPFVDGDQIGKRKLNFHIDALQKFGAKLECDGQTYTATRKQLTACHITLPYPSVGATETCIFLSVLAQGTSVIKNIAIEPEIKELITMLCSMGAQIYVSNYREVTIKGVKNLHGTNFYIIGDRIEAASWAALAGASNGRIIVSGIKPSLLSNFLLHYTLIGGGYRILGPEKIEFYRETMLLSSTIIETDTYPGFSTDWQQPFAIMMTQGNGASVIHETVYEERFGYLSIIERLGGKVQTFTKCLGSLPCRYNGHDHIHSAIIHGSTILVATTDMQLKIPDIRAGLAFLICGAITQGGITLARAELLERGYGNLVIKFANSNLRLQRITGCITE